MTRVQQFTIRTIALLVTVLVLGTQFSLREVHAAQPSFTGTGRLTGSINKTTPRACGSWGVVSSPNAGASDNQLFGVAAVSKSNIWTVGFYANSNQVYQTLIEHWNGTNWSVVSSPNVGAGGNFLFGVAALSKSNIWAVGDEASSGLQQTLIEHWNGTSWSVVSSPNIGSESNILQNVVAISANNIWAVGHYSGSMPSYSTLIEHWNGTKWSIVSSPNAGTTFNFLNGVTAASANNIWTVGSYANSSGVDQTLIEHWNGSKWKVVSSPNIGTGSNDLYGVVAVSKNNIWAVGAYPNGSGFDQTLVEHWNGTSWSVVSSPNVGTRGNFLDAVAAVSANNIWAVGEFNNNGVFQTLLEHWNGTSWSVVSSPNIGTSNNYLYGVAASKSNIWAVGYYGSSMPSYQTLTEFYC